MTSKILVVEDDKNIQEYLKEMLLETGYSIDSALDGITALNIVKKSPPDLVVLDLGLPDINGETICAEIKKKHPDLPIIILTAKGTTSDIVHGLDLGADDYLAKPFESEELLARIKARLRQKGDTKLKVEELELDNTTLEVKRGSRKISLTPTEFKLLEYLMHNKGRVLSREMILNRIWLSSPDIETRVVDVYMGYLRKKVDANSSKHLIQSIRGFGYVIKD